MILIGIISMNVTAGSDTCQYDHCELAIKNQTDYPMQVKVVNDSVCEFDGITSQDDPGVLQVGMGTYVFSCDEDALREAGSKSITLVVSNDRGYCAEVLITVVNGDAFPVLRRSFVENLSGDCSTFVGVQDNYALAQRSSQPYEVDVDL